MNGTIAWFAENRVAANMFMLMILAAGLFAIPNTQKEIFPNVTLSQINVYAGYPGASPGEVEEAVCIRIERAIIDIPGIDNINTFANTNFCQVEAVVGVNGDTGEIMEQMKANIDGITGFPRNILGPTVEERLLPAKIGQIIVSGDASQKALRHIAETIVNDLMDIGLSRVEMGRELKYQMTIEVSEATLQKYNMSFAEIAAVIKRNSNSISGGAVATSGGAVSVEAVASTKSAEDFADITLRALPDGSRVKLGDVATITDGFREGNRATFYNMKPAIQLEINQEPGRTILEISEIINNYVNNPPRSFPEGISVFMDGDAALAFQSRIGILVDNAVSGLVLVFVTLLLFLNFRLSFWVSVGIAVSFMGGFIILYLMDSSINMISTFGFLIVLGMVVDDAIIIAENIFSQQEKQSGLEGAVKGAQEMAKPVVFAVVTTAVSFAPLLFLPGPDGKMISAVPIIVMATLLFSLIECLLILPAHMSHKPGKPLFTGFKIQDKSRQFMDWALKKFYTPLLIRALRWRYALTVGFFIVFALSLALVGGRWIGVTLLADIDGDNAVANVSFPVGSTNDELKTAVTKIEQAAFDLMNELEAKYGQPQIQRILNRYAWYGDNAAAISLPLGPSRDRTLSNEEILALWQERVGDIPGATKLQFNSKVNNASEDAAISIELRGRNSDELGQAAESIKDLLRKQPAAFNVHDSQSETKDVIKLELKDNAYDLGLDLENLAGQVSQAFQGIEVQSLQRPNGEVKVFLQFPQHERSSLWHLENMRIRVADEFHVPLYAVANVYFKKGPAQILRHDGKRIVIINASIDKTIAPVGKVWNSVYKEGLKDLQQNYPNVKWQTTGRQKSEEDMAERLTSVFMISLLVIYVLIATLFQSYFQPVIVLTAVPFALVGAILGHLLFGLDLTMWSAAGMIAVSGVVVNDNMVLIFYINERRKEGVAIFDAVAAAGVERFRPIILTSLTTTAGLAPMLMEDSFEAVFLVPMAISIAFGVMFATTISLFLIPALYLILNDFANMGKLFKPKTTNWDEEGLIHLDDDAKLFDDSFGDSEKAPGHD